MAVKADPSLEEVLAKTPPGKLDQPCQDEQLCEVARHVTDWLTLAPFLRISEAEEKEILGNWPRSTGKQKIDFFRKWREKYGRKATYRRLCRAFFKAGEVSLVDKVCHVICSRQATSSSESSASDEEKEQDTQLPPSLSRSAHSEPPSTCSSLHHVAPPSLPVPATTSNPLEDLASYLRMTYESQTPDFVGLQWPPPPTLKAFNLAMIHCHEVVRRTPPDEQLVQLTLRGSVDDIMEIKSSIKLEDLFKRKPGSRERMLILIEGAPGSGKSTLAWDICQKWKVRILFHRDFVIVIYVQLRDLEVQLAKEIADLIPMELESERRDAVSALKMCSGDRVLFVLDGWDEFAPGLQRGSLFEKLIVHPGRLGVPLSTILITSRPIASGHLQPYATSRVQIVGFTPDEVGRYFEDVFKDPVTVQKLYDHLKERPTIKASCYLPLNAAIVAHLFMELNYTLPTTLHGLFCSLVLSCIIRHLTNESETEPAITSLNGLPPDVQGVFENICILAYEGTMKSKVIFSREDLRSFNLPENLSALSLMQVVQRFGAGKPSSYHFLHLSIQELLTALHISKLPPPEQVQIFTELFGQPRFDAVFQFYAAFTKLQTEGIRSIIAPMISMSSKEEKRRLLSLIHCLYEAQDASLCYFVASHLDHTLNLEFTSLSPWDCLSLKYFLSCVNSSSSESGSGACEITVLEFTQCNLSPEDIDSLSLRNFVKLVLKGNRVSCACAANLLINNTQLQELSLANCDLTDDGVEEFAAALREHQSLKTLCMNSCTDSRRVTHNVLQAVCNQHSVQHLNITLCPLEIKDVAAALEVNRSLQKLYFFGDEISGNDSAILACSLRKNRTLEELVLWLNSRPRWMREFVWSLRDCHLKKLHIIGHVVTIHSGLSHPMIEQVNWERSDHGLPLLVVVLGQLSFNEEEGHIIL